jgi:hypothetical protein
MRVSNWLVAVLFWNVTATVFPENVLLVATITAGVAVAVAVAVAIAVGLGVAVGAAAEATWLKKKGRLIAGPLLLSPVARSPRQNGV